MTYGGSSPALAAMIMTEDAKTEKYIAGSPCGAYIETPCKFEAYRALSHLYAILILRHSTLMPSLQLALYNVLTVR